VAFFKKNDKHMAGFVFYYDTAGKLTSTC